jgi:cysteine desulfurase
MRVYFDNAATTPILPEVLDAMLPFLKAQFGNPSSQYSYGREARSAVEAARKTIATLLNAQPGEIIFTSGGTEANNMVLHCAVRDLGVKRIITSAAEHHCVLHAVEALEKQARVEVVYLPVDRGGAISLAELEQVLAAEKDKLTLLTLMHANNETGTLLPLEQVATLCQQYGTLLHSDTVQTFAHYRIDTRTLPIDFLSASAHKFHGPKAPDSCLYEKAGISAR